MRFGTLAIVAFAIWGCSSSGSGAPGDSSTAGTAGASAGQPGGGTSSGGGGSATGGSANGGDTNGGAASSTGGVGVGGSAPSGGAAGAAGGAGQRWVPAQGTKFYWDLSNAPPDNTKNVGAYDIDGWNNTAEEVAALHARGIKVVCYMDAGTYEPGRPDSAAFSASLKGSAVQGWPGEFWVDVRPAGPNYAALQAILTARFKTCRDKGFDAVEPDNL
ncbi:MAG TPA: endo alpha-1,4 polygalactosaminidase, partial [Polyangiaceae bacterium]|nr:endo alpha-1,4 polygalactosaminidase [Polyangiaceae bacterium]